MQVVHDSTMSSEPSASTTSSSYEANSLLVIPGLVGDPFLTFDVDLLSGYVVTGTASGSIALWRLDHVTSALLAPPPSSSATTESTNANASSATAAATTVSPTEHKYLDSTKGNGSGNGSSGGADDTGEIVCRVLSSSSEEGVKHVFIYEQQIFAVIGDVHVKIWGSWHDATFQMKKFDRHHEYKTCKESFTLRHELKLLVITVGANDGVFLDLETMQQTPFKLEIPNYSTPVYFDGTHLILLQILESGIKLAQIYDVLSQRLIKTLAFEGKKKFYWGFQLLDYLTPASPPTLVSPSSALASSSSASTVAGPALISGNGSSTSSHPTTQLSTTPVKLLSYISCHNIIKCVPFDSIPSGLSPANLIHDQLPPNHPKTNSLYSYKMQTGTTNARILAYLYDQPSRTFITLNSDAKIKIFTLSTSMTTAPPATSSDSTNSSGGRLVAKYRHVSGTFKLGYPYLLKKVGSFIFYSADEGIFLLRLKNQTN